MAVLDLTSGSQRQCSSGQDEASACQDRIDWLRAEIACRNERQEERRRRLEEVNDFWRERTYAIQKKLNKETLEAKDVETHLESLNYSKTLELPATGPACLHFVDDEPFALISATVIVLNTVTLMREDSSAPNLAQPYFGFNVAFVAFYAIELLLRAILYQRNLLCGAFHLVWWNWLDLLIVATSVFDLCIGPLISDTGGGASFLRYMQLLRALRLFRILRIVRKLVISGIAWAEGPVFQSFIFGCVCFNSLLMGLESDYPDFVAWDYLEHVLLAVFTFEVLVRLRHAGCRYFYHPLDWMWNWLDFSIVAGGILDMWLLPIITIAATKFGQGDDIHPDAGSMSKVMMLLRMARLFRVLRLLRLIHSMPDLYSLVLGILQSLQGMTWVFALAVVLLYTCALLAVRLVGHGLVFGGKVPEDVSGLFPNVPESMFVLFEVMNGDMGSLEDLFKVMPTTKLWCALFIVLSNWAILAILTAVVSENLINSAEHVREQRSKEVEEIEQQLAVEELTSIFNAIDSTGNGEISKSEFEALLADQVQSARLCGAAGLPEEDLKELFRLLSRASFGGAEPVIIHKDFIDGLQIEGRPVSERSMMRLEHRLSSLEEIIHKAIEGASSLSV